jgi:hypothetical protein
MKATRWTFRALCGIAPLILVGCWTPAPYGYQTYPGYYAPPPNQGFVAPPGTIVSPGAPYPAPQLGPPGTPGPSGTWAPAGPGPTPAPMPMIQPPGGPSSSAPMPGAPTGSFNNGPSTFSDPQVGSSPRSEVPVPPPSDPGPPRGSSGPSAGSAPTDNNISPFGSDNNDKPFDNKSSQMPVPKRDDGGPQSVALDGGGPFEAPLDRGDKVDTGVVAVAAKTVDAKTRAGSPNRYDYDRGSYSYLRGVVDFDTRDNSWHIIYNPNPDRTDKYGGAFQLIDNPRLKALHDGDIVFIQGRVHPQLVDSRGKPKYEIGDEVARITYRRDAHSVGN